MKSIALNVFRLSVFRLFAGLSLLLLTCGTLVGQSQSPTPTPDQRGLGIQSASPTPPPQTSQQSREAKPELVLQTGYNNIFGATRLVFSPDGRLLATGTFRSNTIKLWETATNRKLRDLSSSGQTASGLAPSIAFSRDGRLIAASAADNSIKVWDVNSGRVPGAGRRPEPGRSIGRPCRPGA